MHVGTAIARMDSASDRKFCAHSGTRRVTHLEENAAAAEIVLESDEIAEIDELFPRQGAASGARHDYDRSKELNI